MPRLKNPRPRLRGKLSKPAPISFTNLQAAMHKASSLMVLPKRGGAFGGVTRVERARCKARENGFAKEPVTTGTVEA